MPFDAALARGLGSLPDVDRRLAHELAAGVLRQGNGLDAVLKPFVPRGLSSVQPALLDVLRVATYQLRHLERVPAHAAVATAVALARETQGERTTGFVNAVLRRVAGLGRDVTADPAASDVARLTEAWSHPSWLIERWIARFGHDATEALLAWNNTHPALVLQPARVTFDELQAVFAEGGIENFPAPYNAGIVVAETRPERLPGFAAGLFYVQDPAQSLVMRFAAFADGVLVYDACAAPGGKTLGLGRTARAVIAADVSRRRLARLRENLQRAGHGPERVIVADALHPPIRPVEAYLLDAPCLGTGTFARHPDARLRVRPAALERLVAEQAALLDAAADRIVVGGVLCYATCSLEPEEDDEQVSAFLARRPEFRREPPPGFPVDLLSSEGDLVVLPQLHGMDGAFAARLVRTD